MLVQNIHHSLKEPIELIRSNLVHFDSSFIKREPIELRSNLVHLA
jgi:hypothetical protein